LPTIQALYEIMESRSSDMRIAQGFRALSLSTVSGSTSFAVDDIVYKTPSAIPEPGTLLLVRSGIEGLLQLAVGS
jgi:hypothetical protein